MSRLLTHWTDNNIAWLKLNYKKLGPSNCSKILNKNHKAVYYKAKTLKLKYKYPSDIDISQFTNIHKKETSYLLGILYADGTIRHTKKRICYPITLSSKTTDANSIYNVIMSTGNWKFYTYKQNKKYLISKFVIHDKDLWHFLYKNDYYEKSKRSAHKILSKIPNNLKSYFFRGFLDGDGCVRTKPEKAVVFTGHLNQNWTFMIDLLKSMNIIFKISNLKFKAKNNKLHCGSQLRIRNREDTIKFLNYVYSNYPNDNIGLLRKYNSYLDIITNTKKIIDKRHCISKHQNKKNTLFKLRLTENKIKYYRCFPTEKDALKFKYKIMSKENTEEYRLRNLTNYWEFKTKYNNPQIIFNRNEMNPD